VAVAVDEEGEGDVVEEVKLFKVQLKMDHGQLDNIAS
jgi:hypothetical protein